MFRYQTPRVFTQMAYNYMDYGYCGCTVTDTPDMFIIERIRPYYV